MSVAKDNDTCQQPGCNKKVIAKDDCAMHYNRMIRYGTYDEPKRRGEPPSMLTATQKTLRSRLWDANVFA